jgi:hypothetical protein
MRRRKFHKYAWGAGVVGGGGQARHLSPPPNISKKKINLKKEEICHVLTPKIMIIFFDIIFSVLNNLGMA